MKTVFDAIMIGLGAMGSSACCHLARRGLMVLGLDQHSLVHDRGSSHGETRLIRKAYFEKPDYVPLLCIAFELWTQLQSECAEALFECNGLVSVAPA
ncbi:FAD-dependent oxidoreductase [Methylocystis sp. IM3]|uniref:FAD-dependent oxidoreductase n=1 Tax=unclassified Methylocystis TaxID=2625913 RepID=UPI0030F4CD18